MAIPLPLTAVALMAGFFVTTVLASRVGRFLPWALLYHALVFAAFWGLYMAIGFSKNFNLPSNMQKEGAYKGDGPLDVAYYTLVLHTTTGFGDVYPITWYSRVLVIIHLLLVFIATANLLPIGGGVS